MAIYSKNILSASTDGRAIKVVATASAGTVIHTGPVVNTVLDEVWLYAHNTDTVARKLTIQWGAMATPDDDIELTIPAESGLTLVVPGLLIKGNSTAALVVRAYAALTNVINIHGYVNRIA